MGLPLLNFPSILNVTGTVESITNVMEPGGQGASWMIDQIEQIWQGQRIYQNRMRILTSHAYVGPVNIMQALQSICGVFIGNYYIFPLPELSFNPVTPTEQDTGSFCQRITLDQESEDGKIWVATIDYAGFDIRHQLGSQNQQYGSFTPLQFPPIVKWSTAKYHRSYPTDVYGNPFVNTAGDPLENPPPREESTQCLRLILWNSAYEEPFAQSFRDTINQDTFLGFPPSTVKCKDIDGERIYTSDYGYVWRIIYDFEIRQISVNVGNSTNTYGWQDLVLNYGFRAFGGATGVAGPKQPIVLGGVPIVSPVILNADGTYSVINNRQDAINLEQSPQYWLTFINYPYSVFANLNISDTILTDNQ